MLLSMWYPRLRKYTAETVLIDMELPGKERNALIEEVLERWGQVFVRIDELSPKWDQPCKSVGEVWKCLKSANRTLTLLNHTRYLCLRKWVDFEGLRELRCFVDGKITALSQKDSQTQDSKPILSFLDPSLRDSEGQLDDPMLIKVAAIKFCQQFLHVLPYQCTIDLTFDSRLNFSVVGVKPSFREHVGTALFNLDNPSDLWQLERGQAFAVFRYFVTISRGIEQC